MKILKIRTKEELKEMNYQELAATKAALDAAQSTNSTGLNTRAEYDYLRLIMKAQEVLRAKLRGLTPTVGQMIASLKRLPKDNPLEIAIHQSNKAYPIAYVQPEGLGGTLEDGKEMIASGRREDVVRIDVWLPSDDDTMMITSTRRI